ncbi:hypothetical protein F5B20DRAFT_580544 [Whalleya microplaca]|nr:hypothetical protein F5B20DRAFT_580544 [Whalleya microplaca]
MLFLTLISALAAGAFALPSTPAPSEQQNATVFGNGTAMDWVYRDTCGLPQLVKSDKTWLLKAACQLKDHGAPYRCTKLDLNLCFRDDRGSLIASKGGQFIADCDACRIDKSDQMFGCVCKEDRNKVTWTNLDDVITNEDGWLQCFDDAHRGEENC